MNSIRFYDKLQTLKISAAYLCKKITTLSTIFW